MAFVQARGLEPIGISHCGRQQQQPYPIAIGERKELVVHFSYLSQPPLPFAFPLPFIILLAKATKEKKNPTHPLALTPPKSQPFQVHLLANFFNFFLSLHDKGKNQKLTTHFPF
jgi:hypothetical protein